jgi:TonB family protein
MTSGFHGELDRIRARTRRSVAVSAVIHVVILFAWLLTRAPEAAPEEITEITWIEAGELGLPAGEPAPPVEAAAPAPSSPALPAAKEQQLHFAREEATGAVEPSPQEVAAARDRLRDRLSSLREGAADQRAQIAAVTAPVGAARPRTAGFPGEPNGTGRRAGLVRGEAGTSSFPGMALTRVAGSSARPLPAPARVPAAQASPKASPAQSGGTPREVLAGVTLAGPVADRELLSFAAPAYPEWAKREAVEGSVRLYFEVLPDGSVKENVLVQKTSGFEDFDRNATIALRSWRFEPLSGGAVGDQWGNITLNYRLD